MNNEKERQKAQYAAMDWDHMAKQQRGMSTNERLAQLEAFLAPVKVPPGAHRNQQYEIDRIAKATNTENFDEIAERIAMQNDSRVKKSVTSKGQNEYYLWFRSPLTKFRGFWGTLLITYWLPAFLISFLAGPTVLLEGEIDIEHVPAAYLLFLALSAFYIFWIWSFLAASRKYFWLSRLTANKTTLGIYAHHLMSFAAFLFLFVMVGGVIAALGDAKVWSIFTGPLGVAVNPARWLEIPQVLLMAFAAWLKLLAEAPLMFAAICLLPNILIIGCASVGSLPAFPLLFSLKRELLNGYSRNEGFQGIGETIDKLESQGEFVGGVRQQGMLRLKLAYSAEKQLGIKRGAAIGFYVMILGLGALLAVFTWFN